MGKDRWSGPTRQTICFTGSAGTVPYGPCRVLLLLHPCPAGRGELTTNWNGITLGAALSRWHTHLQASDRIGSQRTIDAYLYGVRFLADSVGSHRPLADVTTEDIEALLGSLKRAGKSAGGRAVVFRPIRTFFRWCVARDLLDRSPAERVGAPKAPATPVEFDHRRVTVLPSAST